MNQNQNQMEEIWADIIVAKDDKVYDYTGLYMVSNTGKIYSIRTGKLMKLSTSKNGYKVVNLTKNGKHKQFYVHRLVASTFIKNPLGLPQVNHKNELKDDNRSCNLEWCDEKYNMNYGNRNQKQSMTCYLKRYRKGVFHIMKNKKLIIDGKEINVKTARVIVEDDGGVILRFGFFKKDANFGDFAIRRMCHIVYDEFDFDGVCLFHYDFMLVRFI